LRCVVWWLDTNISKDRAATFFTAVKTSNLALHSHNLTL